MTGMFATSKAGHDKTKLYIIIKEDAQYVYLVDGIYKTLEKPKKKSKKHIQVIKEFDETIVEKIKTQQTIHNEEIKRAIKLYRR